MTAIELLALISTGEGRWDVERRDSGAIAGSVWRTIDGYELLDADDHFVGTFGSIPDAIREVRVLP